jgi:hypothetical protein
VRGKGDRFASWRAAEDFIIDAEHVRSMMRLETNSGSGGGVSGTATHVRNIAIELYAISSLSDLDAPR